MTYRLSPPGFSMANEIVGLCSGGRDYPMLCRAREWATAEAQAAPDSRWPYVEAYLWGATRVTEDPWLRAQHRAQQTSRLTLLRAVRAVLEEADVPAALPEVGGYVVEVLGSDHGRRLWLGPEVDHGTIAPLLQALDEAIRAEASP